MAQPQTIATTLPAFPEDGIECAPITPELARLGYFLRRLQLDDLTGLRELYASTRADELAVVPWTHEAKRAFLDQQFDLQHRHYLSHFTTARFLAIEHRSIGLVGRLYLQCSAPRHLLIDICLLPSHRQHGIGSALVRQCQSHAATLGHGMALHVQSGNLDAQRLYRRLGFRNAEQAGSHWRMVWPDDDEPAASAATANAP